MVVVLIDLMEGKVEQVRAMERVVYYLYFPNQAGINPDQQITYFSRFVNANI